MKTYVLRVLIVNDAVRQSIVDRYFLHTPFHEGWLQGLPGDACLSTYCYASGAHEALGTARARFTEDFGHHSETDFRWTWTCTTSTPLERAAQIIEEVTS